MNSELDNKTKIISFIGITTVLVLLAILIYYIQGSSLDISADIASSDNKWISEEVGDCYYLDIKLFQVDNNNLIHLVCRDKGIDSTDKIKLNFYTRSISGWNPIQIPSGSDLLMHPTRVIAGFDNLSNANIVYQNNPSLAKYNKYIENDWQISDIPDSSAYTLYQMVMDSKNQPNIMTRDTNSNIGLIQFANNSWQNVSIPTTISKTMRSFDIDSQDNIYFYGDENMSSNFVIYSSANDWQAERFEFDDFKPDQGFQAVQDSKYITFQNFLIDSNNKIHALIRKNGMKNNQYATDYYYLTNKNGSWENELVVNDAIYDTDRGVSMALDESNYPHIVYTQTNGMKYKYFDGTSWKSETSVIDNMTANSNLKLVIDKNNISHIIYNYNYSVNLIYHLAKQIAPFKEFNGTYPVTPIPSYIPTSTSTPTYTATIIENTDDADNDDILNESDTTSDSNPNTLIGSPSTNMPSDSFSSSSSPKITKLVSTGASLWFNILIAFLLAIGIGYFMFRDKIHDK